MLDFSACANVDRAKVRVRVKSTRAANVWAKKGILSASVAVARGRSQCVFCAGRGWVDLIQGLAKLSIEENKFGDPVLTARQVDAFIASELGKPQPRSAAELWFGSRGLEIRWKDPYQRELECRRVGQDQYVVGSARSLTARLSGPDDARFD